MSGGVDSSVAAYILKNEGYEVVGVTLKLWHSDTMKSKRGGCCTIEDASDARRVCHRLGIKHYVFNFEQLFKETVVKNFVAEYLSARTPNPCVICNDAVKFRALLDKAVSMGFDYIATGHYARIEKCEVSKANKTKQINYILKKGIDTKKDQSYFLYRMDQNQLSRTLFPVGGLTKREVREIARAQKLPVAEKSESFDICFVGRGGYKDFLKSHVKGDRIKPGNIVDSAGKILGRHEGLPFYTIGQRCGLGIPSKERLYVLRLNAVDNEIVVGTKEDASATSFYVGDVTWCLGHCPRLPAEFSVKIRYLSEEFPAVVSAGKNMLKVSFCTPRFAVTPGQSAVFYDGDAVVGGGVISSVLPPR